MTGHTVYELCRRCDSPTIDVVDDVCRTCGHQNRPLTLTDSVVLLAASVVVSGAIALALGVG